MLKTLLSSCYNNRFLYFICFSFAYFVLNYYSIDTSAAERYHIIIFFLIILLCRQVLCLLATDARALASRLAGQFVDHPPGHLGGRALPHIVQFTHSSASLAHHTTASVPLRACHVCVGKFVYDHVCVCMCVRAFVCVRVRVCVCKSAGAFNRRRRRRRSHFLPPACPFIFATAAYHCGRAAVVSTANLDARGNHSRVLQ